jgi:hypothetical protein
MTLVSADRSSQASSQSSMGSPAAPAWKLGLATAGGSTALTHRPRPTSSWSGQSAPLRRHHGGPRLTGALQPRMHPRIIEPSGLGHAATAAAPCIGRYWQRAFVRHDEIANPPLAAPAGDLTADPGQGGHSAGPFQPVLIHPGQPSGTTHQDLQDTP